MNSSTLSLAGHIAIKQKTFPFRTCQVSFIPEKEKLLIKESFLGKYNEWYVNVAELSENTEKFKSRGVGYEKIAYFNKHSGKTAFLLSVNKPNKTEFNAFIRQLDTLIVEYGRRDYFRSLIKQVPTHVLVNEFNNSYIHELENRGVEIIPFLAFTQKKLRRHLSDK